MQTFDVFLSRRRRTEASRTEKEEKRGANFFVFLFLPKVSKGSSQFLKSHLFWTHTMTTSQDVLDFFFTSYSASLCISVSQKLTCSKRLLHALQNRKKERRAASSSSSDDFTYPLHDVLRKREKVGET